MMNYRLFG